VKTYSPKTYYIDTYGCQANESDSEKLSNILDSLGLESCSSVELADIYIINSCSVRQKSEDKVYGLAKSLVKGERKPFIVLAGCMVGSVKGERIRYSFEELQKRTPWVDLYLSPDELLLLPNFLMERGVLDGSSGKNLIGSFSENIFTSKNGYVNISYGCDNFCSYCVVPYARGKEVSRSREEIFAEIRKLLAQNITEITLCGQNVNSWGLLAEDKKKIRIGNNQKLPFAGLIRDVCSLKEVKKLTFLSSNPFDFTQDLIDAVGNSKVDNYLHIAVQSGNNDILSRMNRKHTVEEYLDLITRIKKTKPNLELGTDIIVGFPGETEDQFMDTVRLFLQVKFNVAFISIYSPRKGTFAEKMYPDDIPLYEKKRRHDYLSKVWKESLKK